MTEQIEKKATPRMWWNSCESQIIQIISFCGCLFLTLSALSKTIAVLNPLNPHDALKNHFTSLKTNLIPVQLRVLE